MSRPSSWTQISNGEPVKFSGPGMRLDVRIKVFDRAFHVHSVVLRLYSNFFRKLLDYADQNPAPGMDGFRYNYVSVISPDGGWRLDLAKKEMVSPTLDNLPREHMARYDAENAFEKLLCALYHKKYIIASLRELSHITELAEAHCCLPCFSASIYTALWHSPNLVDDVPANCGSVLILAQKLRHPVLFREALIHVVCQWQGYNRFLDGHYSLVCVVTAAYNRVCERVLAVNQELFLAMNIGGQVKADICAATRNLDRAILPTQSAHFYRHLHKRWETDRSGKENAMEALEHLLENKLVLSGKNVRAGEGTYEHGFLCAWIEESELPWNLEEDDW